MLNQLKPIEDALAAGYVWALMTGNRYWRVRRNGVTKLWKTRPDEFRIPIKCGLRACGEITHKSNIGAGNPQDRPDFVITTLDPNIAAVQSLPGERGYEFTGLAKFCNAAMTRALQKAMPKAKSIVLANYDDKWVAIIDGILYEYEASDDDYDDTLYWRAPPGQDYRDGKLVKFPPIVTPNPEEFRTDDQGNYLNAEFARLQEG